MGWPVPPSPALDAFADLLAEGLEPGEAAARLGYSNPKQGNSMLQRLRKRLGSQAR